MSALRLSPRAWSGWLRGGRRGRCSIRRRGRRAAGSWRVSPVVGARPAGCRAGEWSREQGALFAVGGEADQVTGCFGGSDPFAPPRAVGGFGLGDHGGGLARLVLGGGAVGVGLLDGLGEVDGRGGEGRGGGEGAGVCALLGGPDAQGAQVGVPPVDSVGVLGDLAPAKGVVVVRVVDSAALADQGVTHAGAFGEGRAADGAVGGGLLGGDAVALLGLDARPAYAGDVLLFGGGGLDGATAVARGRPGAAVVGGAAAAGVCGAVQVHGGCSLRCRVSSGATDCTPYCTEYTSGAGKGARPPARHAPPPCYAPAASRPRAARIAAPTVVNSGPVQCRRACSSYRPGPLHVGPVWQVIVARSRSRGGTVAVRVPPQYGHGSSRVCGRLSRLSACSTRMRARRATLATSSTTTAGTGTCTPVSSCCVTRSSSHTAAQCKPWARLPAWRS